MLEEFLSSFWDESSDIEMSRLCKSIVFKWEVFVDQLSCLRAIVQ